MSEETVQPAPETTGRTENDRRMFGRLRNIRSACQYLQGRIAEVLKESAAMSAKQRRDHIADVLDHAVLHRIDHKIEAQLRAIETIFDVDATELEWGSDEVTSIELTWAEIKESLASAIAAAGNAEQQFKPVQDDLDRIVYCCASLTLSPRINDALQNLRVGQPLDIEFEFGEEFPQNLDLRKRLILELAQEAAVLEGGVVDADQGVVYKVASTRRGQIMSLWRLIAFLLLGLLLPLALAFGGKALPNWPFKVGSVYSLVANYLLILLGSGAHFAIEALKAAKQQTRPNFQALTDWVLWVHVREAKIFRGIAYIWVGYLLLTFGIPGLSWSTAFFAGYSIDSVTEVFLGRFEATVATQTKLLTKP